TRRLTAVHIIIATGSNPARLPVPGADLPGVITSDEILQQEVVPEDIVVVGGGAVGVEFAYLFREMGARATVLEMAPTIMAQEDEEIVHEMERLLRSFGIDLQTGAALESIAQRDGGIEVTFKQGDETKTLQCSTLLMASGRTPNTESLRLDDVQIEHEKGKIRVDENCETSVSGVYAIGDCIRDAGWAHLAAGEGTYVAETIARHPSVMNLAHVPTCYYTHPEIASVGLTEKKAREGERAVRVGKFAFRSNGRAAAAGDHNGFVKVVVDDETEKLLGCQIIGPRATDLIAEAVLALKTDQTLDEIVGSIHAHPTFSEALPEAALAARRGSWQPGSPWPEIES
ncbi:MAG TPA: FAD-dependent oxidoreductase, partial [Abditibacteriaceae bacterium]